MKKFLCILFLLAPVASAQDKQAYDQLQEAKEAAQTEVKKVETALDGTREKRAGASYFGLLSYSPIDLIIPSKEGLTLGYIPHADRTWELEYLKGSVSVPFVVKDLGEMSDTRISLITRSYFGGNSFHLSYGLSYFDFGIHLGDSLVNRVTGGNYPSIDVINIQSLGFNLGIGNRWTFKHNITFGVDWLSWNQPVLITNKDDKFLNHATDESDKDKVRHAINVISYFPRIALLKLQLGILF